MKPIESSALIGLGALGILFGWPMQNHTPAGRFCVIADAPRIARYQAEPALFNGERCEFRYCTPEQGAPADLVLVAVKATALEAAARQIRPFVGPDTVIISVLNGITSEERWNGCTPAACCGAWRWAWTPPAPAGRWPAKTPA